MLDSMHLPSSANFREALYRRSSHCSIAPARRPYPRRSHSTGGRYYLNLMYDGLLTFDALHKTICCIGVGLCMMLEVNFREMLCERY
jgi:hypothetical protein